jgi:hypothetical protein
VKGSGRTCSTHGDVRNPEGRKLFGIPRRVYEYNIKTYVKEIKCEVVDLIHLAQNRGQ